MNVSSTSKEFKDIYRMFACLQKATSPSGSGRAFYCSVVLKMIPLLLLLSWPFLSFSNLSVRAPALSHSAFEPIFLDRFTRLEQNGHRARGCRSPQVTGVICPHPQEAGPRC